MATTPPLAVPRDVTPTEVTNPDVPAGALARMQSGLVQGRDFLRAGRSWREIYPHLSVRRTPDQKLLSRLRWFRARSKFFWADHPLMPGSGLAPNGSPGSGSSPTVSGGGQTGNTIDTTGWEASRSKVLRAGDVIRFGSSGKPGDDSAPGSTEVVRSFEVLADVDSDVNGDATVPIDPPVFSGLSIADGTEVQVENVRLWVALVDANLPQASSMVDKYAGVSATFAEVLAA